MFLLQHGHFHMWSWEELTPQLEGDHSTVPPDPQHSLWGVSWGQGLRVRSEMR